MLIFFIHGVAERNSQYAHSLQDLLQREFRQRQEKIPLFHSSFWGNVYRELEIIWNKIDNAQDPLKHQAFRKGYFSQFVGDAFTYLSSERGARIRKIIADQLIDFIHKNPQETELHIITHSLGTVILWDILFSDKFETHDPAFKIRDILSQNSAVLPDQKIHLKSITTMGTPISLFNIMLEVKLQQVNRLAKQYSSQKLKWLNIIHASDIIAYPIHPVLDDNSLSSLSFSEEYIQEDANPFEATLRQFSEFMKSKPTHHQDIMNIVSYAQVAAGSINAHTYYWNSDKVTGLIVNHILENSENISFSQTNFRQQAIQRLKQVPGFTEDRRIFSYKLNLDKTIIKSYFKDESGYLLFTKNPVGVPNIYIFDRQDVASFAGYVGLIHVNGLKQEVELIQRDLCN